MKGAKLRGQVVTLDEVLPDGVVEIEDEHITAVRPARPEDTPAGRESWILPGFIDLHVHGGGGFTFTTGETDQARGAAAFHTAHGTTTMLASLVTASPDALWQAVVSLGGLVEEGLLAGIHLEGPYVSLARCGAQNPAYLRDPDRGELAGLLEVGPVRMVTLAPELPGALDVVRDLHEAGVVAAIGHTDATYEQTLAAVEAGARVATHLGNAMRPIHHRDPGPIIALLDSPSVVCEQVADGVHLHDGMVRHTVHAAGPDRVALVTDAIAAAGRPDGPYELGGQAVNVRDGVARLAIDGSIAGSTLTMDAAVRRVVHSGVSIVDAARMAATTPAHVLGLGESRGAIAVGQRADLVVLNSELSVIEVLRAGALVVG